MSRSVDVAVQSPVTVKQVHAAFGVEDYWHDRFAAFDTDTSLDTLRIDDEGAVHVEMTVHLVRSVLPAALAKLVPGGLTMTHREVWRPVDEQRVRGEISIAAPAARGSGRGEAWLTPAGSGSELAFAATVRVRMPMVGGTVERFIGGQLGENIPAIQRFTTEWIAGQRSWPQ